MSSPAPSRASAAVPECPPELPSTGLLSFYDRLRRRALETARGKSPRFGRAAIEALLLVPDIFVLLVRLMLDKEVPGEARALIGGALAYFVLPFDLFPEAVVGFGGYLDDVVLAAAVLAHALGGDLEPYARRHWNGDGELRQTLHDIAASAQTLLGRGLYGRLKKALAKRGVEIRD